MTIEGEFYTIREMADILDLKFETTKRRILTAGIEPAKLVSGVRLYSQDALEQIRVVKAKGWQKKQGATADAVGNTEEGV